tara:strand:+ start:541 stop:1056 length:516 start_codon:yes stop_codon:yes gene_type:complete
MGNRTINGANAIIQVTKNDKPVTIGYATGVTVNEAYALNRIDVLGLIDSKDIEPISRTVNGTISLMRMTVGAEGNTIFNGGGAATAGIIPTTTEDQTIGARTQNVMDFMNDGFDLIIKDSAVYDPDNEVLERYKVIGCRPASHSFQLSRGSLMGVNVNFEALALVELDVST